MSHNNVCFGLILMNYLPIQFRGHRGCDRMVVRLTATYVINAYHHCWEFESRSSRGVQQYVI